MAIDYNSQYNEIDKQLMQQIYERRGELDLVDLMLLRNVKDQQLLQQHFETKFKKQDNKNND
jgi:hypothetical protein